MRSPPLSSLSGPHATRALRGREYKLTAEDDEAALARHVKVAAWPPLRENPAVTGKEAPPLPSEIVKVERSARFGSTRVMFKARAASADEVVQAAAQAARREGGSGGHGGGGGHSGGGGDAKSGGSWIIDGSTSSTAGGGECFA